jgi:hypothetical protein
MERIAYRPRIVTLLSLPSFHVCSIGLRSNIPRKGVKWVVKTWSKSALNLGAL